MALAHLSYILLSCFLARQAHGLTTFPDCSQGPLASNAVCDTSKDPITRAQALADALTVPEIVLNSGNAAAGVERLGLPPYEWWSEALHGVANSPGVNFSTSGEWSYATSFPQPITMAAAYDDDLITQVAAIVSTEGRAFNNAGRAGLTFFTPNINPFKDPRWGRGKETPGEDPFHIQRYVYNLVTSLQGGINPEPYLKISANCKHFAAYDLENWHGNIRHQFNAIVDFHDLSEFYLPGFQTCVRDAQVASVMCSYNAVNGIPSCANDYLLQTTLREKWGFTQDKWVTGDCGAVEDIFDQHNYSSTYPQAVAVALKAGTDIDCGDAYQTQLNAAYNESLITRDDLNLAMTHLYSSLVRLGYFDSPEQQPYRQLGWSDVNTPQAQQLAYEAAVKGLVLLKNDGTLPLKSNQRTLALIGPYANATTAMQASYSGVAPFLISPLQAAINAGYKVHAAALNTNVSSTDTSQFGAAVEAAKQADVVIFAGGIDETIEAEQLDRDTLVWPGVQLELIAELEAVGKPLIVLQFGGGQVDDTALKNSNKVNAIAWAGYPGQSGGTAIIDILSGKAAPAGRLVTTQYSADYVNQVPMTNMSLRPGEGNPGRTYKWYTGTPVYEYGHGLHYTTFDLSWKSSPSKSYNIQELISKSGASGSQAPFLDTATFDTFSVNVRNTGHTTSDYVALAFVSGDHGPAPYPNKQLVSYTRLSGVAPGSTSMASLPVTIGALARADEQGNQWLYPGEYKIAIDVPSDISATFSLEGNAAQIIAFPQNQTEPTY